MKWDGRDIFVRLSDKTGERRSDETMDKMLSNVRQVVENYGYSVLSTGNPDATRKVLNGELEVLTKFENDLKQGHFYWVLPVIDVDSDEKWVDKEQPALFLGDDHWILLGTESDEQWPVRWVGPEIKRPE